MDSVNGVHESEPLMNANSRQLRQRPSLLVRLAWLVEDFVTGIRWKHVAYKTVAFAYLGVLLWMMYWVLPLPGHWPSINRQSDRVPLVYQDFFKQVTNDNGRATADDFSYFGGFQGFDKCGIRAKDLYSLPPRDGNGYFAVDAFCPNRQSLLQALSDGGRVGYDAVYQPKECAYRWYSVDEICFILERFDSIVFVGDSSLQAIYNGLNILLRSDLAAGSLQTWDMDQSTKDQCNCNAQFTHPACAKYHVTSSEQVVDNTPANGSPYHCERTPHALLSIGSSPAPPGIIDEYRNLVPQAPRSKYQPVPTIHSLSPTMFSAQTANQSLLEFLQLADESQRKTPMLWIGPAAPGYVEHKDAKSSTEVWDYDHKMAKSAAANDIEVLKMWNMTAQASSHDGVGFGEGVAITQAMMVVNWLSRLESS